MELTLPHGFTPREYQLPLWTYLENGGKRAVAIWHRRAGKDLVAINWCVPCSVERPGLYWHLLPTYNQGRKVVWDGMISPEDGSRPFLDYWPHDLIKSVNNTDMKVETVTGSIYQVVGTDWYDRLVGSNPVGCIFSEYSLQDPQAWELIRPILMQNKGWAIFIYTPRGKNHGYRILKMAEQNDKWFHEKLTVDDTHVVSQEEIEEERKAGMSEELIQQEFFCSFEAGIPGAYYSNEIVRAKKEGRIITFPTLPDVAVDTYWDLGMDDSMAIWFAQNVGREIHLINYFEASGEGLPFYAKKLQEFALDNGYVYGRHVAPHDIKVRELGTGKSRRATGKTLGINFEVARKVQFKEDGINACRNIFPICFFHAKNCARGIDGLENFKKEYDEKKKVFMAQPVRDWAKHPADAFETLAISHEFKRHASTGYSGYKGSGRVTIADSGIGY